MPETPTVLRGISWEVYDRLVTETENPIRLTYDRGELEIVSPSHRHEAWKGLVHDMIVTMAMELDLPIKPGGSTTLRRKSLARGMEPDECFWVEHERDVRDKLDLCFDVDPVPDLVLEAGASRSVLDRLGILADLGVGEVWRYDGERLVILVRDQSGAYGESPNSRCFPWLPIPEFAAHVARYRESDHTTWLKRFRDWVRTSVKIG